MSRETLLKMSKTELRVLAGGFNVIGRWRMTKDELVDALVNAMIVATVTTATTEQNDLEEDAANCGAENSAVNTAYDTNDCGSGCTDNGVKIDMERKLGYIENAEIGTLVAFRLASGRVKSAKIINKSSKAQKLRVETEYGAIYVISYEDVLWVRTGPRWPAGVYRLLKGLDKEVEQNAI